VQSSRGGESPSTSTAGPAGIEQGGDWISHGSNGGGFSTAHTLATSGDGRLEVFVVDGSLHQISQTAVGADSWWA
jgi:hypothetical protein